MAGDSIKVKPSGLPGAVDIAVDTVGNRTWPEYKLVYSLQGAEPVHVSTSDPFPVSMYSSDGTEFGTPGNPLSVRDAFNSELDTKQQLNAVIYLLEILANRDVGTTIDIVKE